MAINSFWLLQEPSTAYAVNGTSAILRALLTAVVTIRWCLAQLPEMRLGIILPLSEIVVRTIFTSL